MGTKYSSKSASGYNTSPPADDGTASEANKVKWSTIKTKLADVVKTLADDINSALVTHFDVGPTAKSTTFTTTAAEYGKTLEVSSGATINLIDAATGGAGYHVTIHNTGASAVTVGRDTGSDTIDGAAANLSLARNCSATFLVNAGATGFLVTSNRYVGEFASGTKMVFYQAAAPTGWTQDTSKNNYMIRTVSGTGGGSGGSGSPISYTPTISGNTASHTLLLSEIPSHSHSTSVNVQHSATGTSSARLAAGSGSTDASFTAFAGGTAGSGGGHSHGAGTLSASAFAPLYIDCILASKN